MGKGDGGDRAAGRLGGHQRGRPIGAYHRGPQKLDEAVAHFGCPHARFLFTTPPTPLHTSSHPQELAEEEALAYAKLGGTSWVSSSLTKGSKGLIGTGAEGLAPVFVKTSRWTSASPLLLSRCVGQRGGGETGLEIC